MIGQIFYSQGGKLGTLDIDVTVRESHSMQSQVTDSPVESGTDVTDHVRNAPRSVTIEGVISKTPVNVAQFNPLRYRNAFSKLEKMHAAREPVTVITALRQYDNMVIMSIDVERDHDTANVIRFAAQLRQVRIVKTGKDALADAAKDTLASEADGGPQSGTAL